MLHALVYGKPATKGSKRGFVKNGKAILVEDNKGLKGWSEALRWSAAQCRPTTLIDVPVEVSLFIFQKRPGTHYGTKKGERYLKEQFRDAKPSSGLDADKVARSVGDCLTGIWLTDDRRITDWTIKRRYTEGAERCVVLCWEEATSDYNWENQLIDMIGEEASGG